MTTRTHTRPRARHLVLPLVLALVVTLLGGPALASGGPRTFTADFWPRAVDGDSVVTFTAVLKNTSSNQKFGSANITAPQASDITLLAGATTTHGSSDVKDGVLELRGMALEPDETVTVTFSADTGCQSGRFDWQVQGKQANNFSGPPGNDLRFTGGKTDVTVAGGCAVALQFVDGRHPANAERNAVISSQPFRPDGDPVQVEAVDGAGERVASFNGDVTVELTDDSPAATLGGTGVVTAVQGVATFSTLKIDTSGLGYGLEASSGDLTPAASDPFNIYDKACLSGQECQSSTGDLVGDQQQTTARGTGGPGGGGLIVAFADDLTTLLEECVAGINQGPAASRLIGDGLTSKTAQFLVAKEWDQRQPNNGAAFYQVCATPLDKDSHFDDRDGNRVKVGEVGLLPDCVDHPSPQRRVGPPCVESRTKTAGADILVTVRWGSRFAMR